jgi:hypothetical protein
MDSPIVKTPNNSSSNDMTLIFYLFRWHSTIAKMQFPKA